MKGFFQKACGTYLSGVQVRPPILTSEGQSSIICLLKPIGHTLSRPVYEPIAMLCVGAVSNLGGVELGGQVWYTANVRHIRHNLSAETVTLSSSFYIAIHAIHVLRGGPPPI